MLTALLAILLVLAVSVAVLAHRLMALEERVDQLAARPRPRRRQGPPF